MAKNIHLSANVISQILLNGFCEVCPENGEQFYLTPFKHYINVDKTDYRYALLKDGTLDGRAFANKSDAISYMDEVGNAPILLFRSDAQEVFPIKSLLGKQFVEIKDGPHPSGEENRYGVAWQGMNIITNTEAELNEVIVEYEKQFWHPWIVGTLVDNKTPTAFLYKPKDCDCEWKEPDDLDRNKPLWIEKQKIPQQKVYVQVEAHGDISYDDDMDAPGEYEILLPANATNIASCALDSFHERVAIKNLDEFNIWVEDAAGNTIEESEDAPLSYQSEFRGEVEKIFPEEDATPSDAALKPPAQ